ncbi:MAG: ribosomal protein S18-alanine N-acetyltransferase [Dehalococcoidia bacterium]
MHLRRLTKDDIEAAAAIEERAFQTGWAPTTFRRELEENRLARYIVADGGREGGRIAGFAGLWAVVDQAHIVTVAVEPDLRRRGIGRLLVVGLLTLARDLGLTDATLECRSSNSAARALYRALGFHEVGRRPRYYDNAEDAVIMTTDGFGTEAFEKTYGRARGELELHWPGALTHLAGRASETGGDL